MFYTVLSDNHPNATKLLTVRKSNDVFARNLCLHLYLERTNTKKFSIVNVLLYKNPSC